MHRNVRNIGTPDLIRPFDGDPAEEVRIDLVTWSRAAQVRFRVERFDAQDTHQPLNTFAVDLSVTAIRRLPKNGQSNHSGIVAKT
jgi:hypothetical protein